MALFRVPSVALMLCVLQAAFALPSTWLVPGQSCNETEVRVRLLNTLGYVHVARVSPTSSGFTPNTTACNWDTYAISESSCMDDGSNSEVYICRVLLKDLISMHPYAYTYSVSKVPPEAHEKVASFYAPWCPGPDIAKLTSCGTKYSWHSTNEGAKLYFIADLEQNEESVAVASALANAANEDSAPSCTEMQKKHLCVAGFPTQILLGGDTSYAGGDVSRWDSFIDAVGGPLLSRFVTFIIPGNHDMYGDTPYFAARFAVNITAPPVFSCDMPRRFALGYYFSFDLAELHVVGICHYCSLQHNSTQTQFITTDLACAAQDPSRRIIAAVHTPWYVSTLRNDGAASRDALERSFAQYNVKILLAGHEHTAEVTYPLVYGSIDPNGTVHVTSGHGGAYSNFSDGAEWQPVAPIWSAKRRIHNYGFSVLSASSEDIDIRVQQVEQQDAVVTSWYHTSINTLTDTIPIAPQPATSPATTALPEPSISSKPTRSPTSTLRSSASIPSIPGTARSAIATASSICTPSTTDSAHASAAESVATTKQLSPSTSVSATASMTATGSNSQTVTRTPKGSKSGTPSVHPSNSSRPLFPNEGEQGAFAISDVVPAVVGTVALCLIALVLLAWLKSRRDRRLRGDLPPPTRFRPQAADLELPEQHSSPDSDDERSRLTLAGGRTVSIGPLQGQGQHEARSASRTTTQETRSAESGAKSSAVKKLTIASKPVLTSSDNGWDWDDDDDFDVEVGAAQRNAPAATTQHHSTPPTGKTAKQKKSPPPQKKSVVPVEISVASFEPTESKDGWAFDDDVEL